MLIPRLRKKLYFLAGDWASLGLDTKVFDICFGTETIGLTLGHRTCWYGNGLHLDSNDFHILFDI